MVDVHSIAQCQKNNEKPNRGQKAQSSTALANGARTGTKTTRPGMAPMLAEGGVSTCVPAPYSPMGGWGLATRIPLSTERRRRDRIHQRPAVLLWLRDIPPGHHNGGYGGTALPQAPIIFGTVFRRRTNNRHSGTNGIRQHFLHRPRVHVLRNRSRFPTSILPGYRHPTGCVKP